MSAALYMLAVIAIVGAALCVGGALLNLCERWQRRRSRRNRFVKHARLRETCDSRAWQRQFSAWWAR